jgi:hypothetical protein
MNANPINSLDGTKYMLGRMQAGLKGAQERLVSTQNATTLIAEYVVGYERDERTGRRVPVCHEVAVTPTSTFSYERTPNEVEVGGVRVTGENGRTEVIWFDHVKNRQISEVESAIRHYNSAIERLERAIAQFVEQF